MEGGAVGTLTLGTRATGVDGASVWVDIVKTTSMAVRELSGVDDIADVFGLEGCPGKIVVVLGVGWRCTVCYTKEQTRGSF